MVKLRSGTVYIDKELFKEEIAKGEFVKECNLETDLNLVIPDDYVNEITERLSLYRELDHIEKEEELIEYQKRLIDRFGEVPNETLELMNAVRLRWIAKDIGFEKLVLKKNVLIGTFITDQNSVYYQSDKFTRVLNFIQNGFVQMNDVVAFAKGIVQMFCWTHYKIRFFRGMVVFYLTTTDQFAINIRPWY